MTSLKALHDFLLLDLVGGGMNAACTSNEEVREVGMRILVVVGGGATPAGRQGLPGAKTESAPALLPIVAKGEKAPGQSPPRLIPGAGAKKPGKNSEKTS